VSGHPLAILLNGPLGIGKSTLGEVLGEAVERSVTIDGDQLLALNPSPNDENSALHQVVALLVEHHLSRGYDRFILNHYWSSAAQISDLMAGLQSIDPRFQVHCFRLTLPKEENLQRIALRQKVRAIDETEFEAEHFTEEHALLTAAGDELGMPFDVSDPPDVLAARLIKALGI
jgi:predicted ABC-type ATPase